MRHGVAMARSTDPLILCRDRRPRTTVRGIPNGVLRPGDSAVREIEEALRIAERSGDDLALAIVKCGAGDGAGASANRRQTVTAGWTLLAQVRDMCLRRQYYLAELPVVDLYVSR